MEVKRLGIIGTGLIGASVGLAAKRAGVPLVEGYDFYDNVAEAARERGAVDQTAIAVDALLAASELVIVAVPVIALQSVLREAVGTDATVTDVGSTKSNLREALTQSNFVGGHPVTGSEAHGPEHATADLFDGATWFLTPTAQTDPERYRLVHGFVSALGATPVAIDPQAHDQLVAVTSHLPHALANALMRLAACGSLRDMTRVAGANPRIWVDIFLENTDALRGALGEHRRRLEQLESALEARDAGFIARWIGEASDNRRQMLERAFPDPGELHQLRVHVPDRPGVLAGITQALGAQRINIEDFELHHVSPERGGTLTLLVTGAGEAERAATLLESQGYGVVVSPVLGE